MSTSANLAKALESDYGALNLGPDIPPETQLAWDRQKAEQEKAEQKAVEEPKPKPARGRKPRFAIRVRQQTAKGKSYVYYECRFEHRGKLYQRVSKHRAVVERWLERNRKKLGI